MKGSRAETEKMPWIKRRGFTLEALDIPIALRNLREMENRKRKKTFSPLPTVRAQREFFLQPLRRLQLSVTSAARISHRTLILRALCVL